MVVSKRPATFVDLPDRSEVLERLAALADGRTSPEEASDWAGQWILADQIEGVEVRITDWPVWEALKLMLGADLFGSDRRYLVGPVDFRAWLNELRQAALPRR